jgi:alginate O-acetyltransferase complex protein AlgI
MVFNSLQFLVFFMVVTLAYYRMKKQGSRVWLLLLSSCYFYMTFVPKYILILGFTIIIDYLAGLQIERSKGKKRKAWLVASIIANVGILAYYKYFNFILDSIAPAITSLFPHYQLPYLDILLPIGLSFHTFQAMSYTIEVYRGKQASERNFTVYALYVMFYPQLVAGPIERPQNVLHQFHEYKAYNYDNVKEGLSRMLWGFFKKVVVADRLAMAVNYIYQDYGGASGWVLILGAVFYSFQIYCDFSGYSDIGIGAAKVMGIDLMENFNQPYLSRNITTFWSRWHISLSTWFRDYVYIPLGGNRKGEARRKVNAFIVFLLSGLWHGANWTFVAWGALHGALVTLVPGRYKKKDGKGNWLVTTFFVLVNFALVACLWVFFRSPNIASAFGYLKGMFTMQHGFTDYGMSFTEMLFSLLVIGVVLCREFWLPAFKIKNDTRFIAYFILMALACYFFGVFGENQFIYFQF